MYGGLSVWSPEWFGVLNVYMYEGMYMHRGLSVYGGQNFMEDSGLNVNGDLYMKDSVCLEA